MGNHALRPEIRDAIETGDADAAERVMRSHVQNFYDKVRGILIEEMD